MNIEIKRYDNIDAFGAYAAKEDLILINVEAHIIASIEENISLKEILLETIVHEFAHCMEEKLELEFTENRVEKIINTYKEKYGKK